MKLKTLISVAAFSTVAVAAGAASVLLSSKPACAQTFEECFQNLVRSGVSPDVAATTCNAQVNSPTACVDRLRFVTARASGGQTQGGTWRFAETYGPTDGSAMRAAGCRQAGFLGVDGWRCPNQEMRFEVMTAQQAQAACSGATANNMGNSSTQPNTPFNRPNSNTGNTINQPPRPTTTAAVSAIVNTSGTVPQNGHGVQTFAGHAGQNIRILVSGIRGFDPHTFLIGPDGTLLIDNDDRIPGSDTNSEISGTLPQNGTYQIFVEGYNGAAGTYTILVESR
ncbi:PPC domain-containing protein [Oscillatoria sp. FACHB-1407]|uniref:PPC domain-containing protein n=1 Tax=Oscillatoria sp. FACHB-1407 TaxID=2692847 RepID=UPI0016882C82|nr:PPC domain-containing protein [Oscillatoria sp. FACHB-1407]MBD2463595.1 PPC domain-containing protein [Oscillatoria sp. FACHB-1407]